MVHQLRARCQAKNCDCDACRVNKSSLCDCECLCLSSYWSFVCPSVCGASFLQPDDVRCKLAFAPSKDVTREGMSDELKEFLSFLFLSLGSLFYTYFILQNIISYFVVFAEPCKSCAGGIRGEHGEGKRERRRNKHTSRTNNTTLIKIV